MVWDVYTRASVGSFGCIPRRSQFFGTAQLKPTNDAAANAISMDATAYLGIR